MKSILHAYSLLVGIWADAYEKDRVKFATALSNVQVPVKICNEIYRQLTSDGAMKKLEELTNEERQGFYDFKPIVDEGQNKDKLSVYKALHTIDFIKDNI